MRRTALLFLYSLLVTLVIGCGALLIKAEELFLIAIIFGVPTLIAFYRSRNQQLYNFIHNHSRTFYTTAIAFLFFSVSFLTQSLIQGKSLINETYKSDRGVFSPDPPSVIGSAEQHGEDNTPILGRTGENQNVNDSPGSIDDDFSGRSFSGEDLRGFSFTRDNLAFANFSNADLRRANLTYANMDEVNLSGARLSYADINATSLRRADLSDATLFGSMLISADLSSADLHFVDLSHADLDSAVLDFADLSGADLHFTNLLNTDLDFANLYLADLSSAENLTKEQLEHAKLCKTQLPSNIDLDPNRDCPTSQPPDQSTD